MKIYILNFAIFSLKNFCTSEKHFTFHENDLSTFLESFYFPAPHDPDYKLFTVLTVTYLLPEIFDFQKFLTNFSVT